MCRLHFTQSCVMLSAGLVLHCTGIIDDDFGMELLVLGNLISLNLPVRLVFEGLWLPAQSQQQQASSRSPAGPPMRITFRLQVRSPA